jgi:hypothetical protein
VELDVRRALALSRPAGVRYPLALKVLAATSVDEVQQMSCRGRRTGLTLEGNQRPQSAMSQRNLARALS